MDKDYKQEKDKLSYLEDFICLLIDKHEGSVITEEYLHHRYAEFLKNKGIK
jgi:hypothetical protein